MNLGYIKSEIYNLGFSTEADVPIDIVTQAINRAITTIASTVRPILSKYIISQYKLNNMVTGVNYGRHKSGETLTYNGEGVSFYFECDGNGTVVIEDSFDSATIEMKSNREFVSYKGFCSGVTTITFSGDFAYNVRNVAIYDEKTSDDEIDIPSPSNNAYYDFAKIAKDRGETFVGFADKYKKGDIEGTLTEVKDFDIIDSSTLRLKANDETEYTIFYKRLHTFIEPSTPDSLEIELDADLQPLLPLLAAFYVWQDDEERKADKYYNDYETKRNDILAREGRAIARVNGGVDI